MAKLKVEDFLYETNVAEKLDDDLLEDIGHRLLELVNEDDRSRQAWLEDQESWLKLASQVRDVKNFPWQNASNVKYPLMTIAALQFHARALPGLINSSSPVRARVIGRDYDGKKQKRADRIGKYMSYQVLEEMSEWVDEMDRLLFVLPIVGLCFKKTYFSEALGRVKSILVMPSDLIINYHANSYERARMSHVMLMDPNEVRELQNQGIYLDVELTQQYKDIEGPRDEIIGLTHSEVSEDEPYEIVESHCWLDLDEDGYREPYIVTFHRDSGKVLRIMARWEEGSIVYGSGNDIVKITAMDYFTPFQFLPDPSSAVYGIGFGRLLGPTNETTNTLINQLVDAGTLSNLQSGFLARGVKLTGGATRFRPGEWKIVNTSGDDLRKGIVPMPVREPSNVLFQLLGFLVEAGQQISSVSDIMMGENPGQNQPASTTMAVLEQGLKVFTGIYKRIHRSLGKEYKKIYRLDRMYLNEEMYNLVLDEQIPVPEIGPEVPQEEAQMIMAQVEQLRAAQWATIADFSGADMDVVPASDPNIVSDAQKSVKAQSLIEKASMGLPVNIQVATQRALEAEGHEDIEAIMTLPEPPPSVEQMEFQLETIKTQIDAFRAYFESIERIAKAEAAEAGQQLDLYRGIVDDHVKVSGLEQQMKGAQQSGQTKK